MKAIEITWGWNGTDDDTGTAVVLKSEANKKLREAYTTTRSLTKDALEYHNKWIDAEGRAAHLTHACNLLDKVIIKLKSTNEDLGIMVDEVANKAHEYEEEREYNARLVEQRDKIIGLAGVGFRKKLEEKEYQIRCLMTLERWARERAEKLDKTLRGALDSGTDADEKVRELEAKLTALEKERANAWAVQSPCKDCQYLPSKLLDRIALLASALKLQCMYGHGDCGICSNSSPCPVRRR